MADSKITAGLALIAIGVLLTVILVPMSFADLDYYEVSILL